MEKKTCRYRGVWRYCDLQSLRSCREIIQKDYEIKVVMTKHAQEFVKPINFESLSKHKCEVSLFDETNEDPIAHITLAKWADIMVLVPATPISLPKLFMVLRMILFQQHSWLVILKN